MCFVRWRRAPKLLRGAILLAAGLIATAARTEPVLPTSSLRPILEVRETSRDAGIVEEGAEVQCRFVLRNRGTGDLEIARVKADCGCTAVHWDRLLKPGAESVLEAEVRTDGFHGRITKRFTVFSNDPAQPELSLSVSAQLVAPVQITPGPAALLAVGERPAAQEFIVARRGGQPMRIVQLVPNASFLHVVSTPLPGQGRFKVTVTASNDAPLGRTVIPVVVQTDLPKRGALTLVLTVDRGVVAVPPVLFCGLLQQDLRHPVHAVATILHHTGTFHVQGVSVDDPKLTARLETVRDGAEYRVTVSYAGGWEPGMVEKTLVVTTDDPQQPVLKIPVEALIHPSSGPAPPPSARPPETDQ
jgi:hypothetical protein